MSDFLRGKKITVHDDCYPCFLRQTHIALEYGNGSEEVRRKVLSAVIKDIENAGKAESPAHATTRMHRTIRELMGGDPFREIKKKYNAIALSLYPRLKAQVINSADPLLTATRLAIAGNVIDFGIFTSVDIEGTIRKALERHIEVDEYPDFKAAVEGSSDILYLLDNAGEAVFDRLLIETLMGRGKKVAAVTKGSPVLNDCTLEDAVEAGLPCELVSNGSDAVGTILENTDEGFRRRFSAASLIISKGQGNFETLLGKGSQSNKKIFFLFQSKCDVVSRVLGLPKGAMLLVENR